MQISIQKLQIVVVGILAVALLGLFAYFGYIVFFTGPKPEENISLASVNVGAFSGFPKLQKVAEAVSGSSDKFALKKKNYSFVDSPIYKSITDDPVTVTITEKRGRPNPFIPYVAP